VNTNHQTIRVAGLGAAKVACLCALVLSALTGCGGVDPTEEGQSSDQGPSAASEETIAESQQALGSCSKGTRDGGHTAVAKCSGYNNTGTFRVVTTCCLTRCSGTVSGRWAYLAGGTSTASCGGGYATNVKIEYGPNTG
jgi:hypothetical protein